MTLLRPALVCGALLGALDASDGRRRRRKRDTTPDAIGMSFKRELLTQAIEADPDPDIFEVWLLDRCLTRSEGASTGALRAMAQEVYEALRAYDVYLVAWSSRDMPPIPAEFIQAVAEAAGRF